MTPQIQMNALKCNRCGHVWLPRRLKVDHRNPKVCASCKSRRWDKPRERKIKIKKK